MGNFTLQTTLSLPADLLEATDRAVLAGKAQDRNEFVALALRHELAAQRRAEIDAEFAQRANDLQFPAEALAIAEEFAEADWEAFQLGESKE